MWCRDAVTCPTFVLSAALETESGIYDFTVNKSAKNSAQCTHGDIHGRGQPLLFVHDLAEHPQALRHAQQKITHRFFIQSRIEDAFRLSANNGGREQC